MGKNTAAKVSWGILFVLFIYMWALNYFMPLHRDDYWYSLVWGTLDKLTSWPEVFKSLHAHYFTHGGRMVPYFLLDSFLLLGKPWFNPFNAFLYVILMLLMYWHSQRKVTVQINPYTLSIILLFSWLGLPHFAETNLWMAGACGYLFTAVLVLTFLLPYHIVFWGEPPLRDHAGSIAGMFAAGILAGWSIENTATTVTLLTSVITIYFYRTDKLKKWMVSGLVGVATGLAMLILAPGNYVRYEDSQTKLIYHFTNLIVAGAETLFYVLPVVLFLLLAWRILVVDVQNRTEDSLTGMGMKSPTMPISFLVTPVVIGAVLISYLNNGIIAKMTGEFLINQVATPLGLATPRLKVQLFNTLSGLEEFTIYLLIVIYLFQYLTRRLSLQKKDIRMFSGSWAMIVKKYPETYYALAWLALSVINHLVMVASPRYPGRAAYGSVVFLIIGAATVFSIPKVYETLCGAAQKKYAALLMGILAIPMMTVVLYQHVILFHEDSQRIAYIESQVQQGAQVVTVEPISIKFRVLRHIYYEDVNNSLSKDFLCNYYGLKDIYLSNEKK